MLTAPLQIYGMKMTVMPPWRVFQETEDKQISPTSTPAKAEKSDVGNDE